MTALPPDNLPEPPGLPPRDTHGHKGTFGTVCVFGGCAGPDVMMIGAPALVAMGALRAGAGLVKLAVPRPILDSVISITPSATGIPLAVDEAGSLETQDAVSRLDHMTSECRCLVVGPGLGSGGAARSLSLRAVQQQDCPVVVDADALNALAEMPELFRDFHARAVLTPHPGEFRRLAATFRISQDPTKEETRPVAAESLAQKLGCIVVLKGAGTIVSDGQRTWRCSAGHPCLATAGTGDVLSGVIAGLIAQFVPRMALPRAMPGTLDLFDAARLGVLAHGRAGERWASRRPADAGLLAAELADEIPAVIAELRSK